MSRPGIKRRTFAGGDPEKDFFEFMPLGSGQEVGRSCHIVKYKGKTIMVRHLDEEILRPKVSCESLAHL